MEILTNLLHQISTIQKKYDDLAEYSGENYNVFDILGVRSDELSHSAILTNLLNARGKHGQKNVFLNLFIKQFQNKFEKCENRKGLLRDFEQSKSFAVTEKHAGKVDNVAEEGGRIDIVVNDGKSNIIIENKIYAGDQPEQLLRYNKYDRNAPIFYLTLDGKVPSHNSVSTLLINQQHYISISYEIDIVIWLQNCIKEMANKPIIRETLNQYLNLVKQLTNQSNSYIMENEIIEIILHDSKSFETAKQINRSLNFIENHLLCKLDEIFKLGKSLEKDISDKIKLNSNLQDFKILPRFKHNGKDLIRFDLVFSQQEKLYECIMIEICISDYELCNFVHSNSKNVNYFLQQKVGSKTEIHYNYIETKEEIFEKIQLQINHIVEIFKEFTF